MPGIGTRSGRVFEQLAVPVLTENGYSVETQCVVGEGLGGGAYKVDAVVTTPDARRILVSQKWQQVSGSADTKVVYEVVVLLSILRSKPLFYHDAYIVLGGDGFSRRLQTYYLSGKLKEYIPDASRVKLVTLNQFVTLANKREL